jgi:predicted nucleotidyltransferase
MTTRVPIDTAALADLCRRHYILRLSFYGSVLRDDFGPQSDVDVLVEFEPERVPGFFRLALIEGELSQLIGGRHVDLVTPKFINYRIRRRVLETADVAYAEG